MFDVVCVFLNVFLLCVVLVMMLLLLLLKCVMLKFVCRSVVKCCGLNGVCVMYVNVLFDVDVVLLVVVIVV